MASSTEDLDSTLVPEEVDDIKKNIERKLRKLQLCRRSKIYAMGEVLLYALKVDVLNDSEISSETTSSTMEATSSTMDDKPSSIPDKYNEAIVKEICGEVNTDIKQLFSIHFDCDVDKKSMSMKLIKKNLKKSAKVFRTMKTIMASVNNDFIKDKKDFLKSIKEKTYPYQTYPLRIDKDPPVMVLGPHSTEVLESKYAKVRWSTPQAATRMLFNLVFSYSDILMANHSVTSVDPYKLSDIEHCVKVKTKGAAEAIRKAIAKKMVDTGIKYTKHSCYI